MTAWRWTVMPRGPVLILAVSLVLAVVAVLLNARLGGDLEWGLGAVVLLIGAIRAFFVYRDRRGAPERRDE